MDPRRATKWINYLVLLGWLGLISIRPFPATGQVVAQSAAADDWPMYQHDPAHSGRTTAAAYNNGPLYLQWAYSFGERVEVQVQPVLANGVIYVGVMNGEMHAIEATTGARRWMVRPGGPIAHTAAVEGNRVYFGSLDGNVYARYTADGSPAWQFPTGKPVVSAPVVVAGRLYIGSNDGNLYALDAAKGTQLWRVTTGGPVVSSPAVAGGRVYFSSEDMIARCVNAATGAPVWEAPLHGAGMHNTHPVVSDDGKVVIFLTVKPGGSSYVPLEGYPNASASADPVATWNQYYQAHPTHRYLYYLNAETGADLWNPATLRYVPLPIPYWGLIHPILGPDGAAWFPAPAGTSGYNYGLDHDDRLFKVDLLTGSTTQVAGGPSLPEFQLRDDEVGRQMFSGNDYYYTISEDLGVYHPSNGSKRALFTNGDPTGYNFGTHMNPYSPLPSRHLWRYGGAIAMGGVPGASPPIVANNMTYFTSYGWLYAVGQTNHGYDPATSFPARDARLHELTYPRTQAPSTTEIQAELDQRVGDIIALGHDHPPLAARWEQADKQMLSNEFDFELYGFEADLVRALSEAYPYLSSQRKTLLKTYLSDLVQDTLLNASHYAYTGSKYCLVFGEAGVQTGNNCSVSGEIASRWWSDNPNLIGLRLYALFAYANATGDWASSQSHWSLITQQFQVFNNAYNASLGFGKFDEWHTGRLNLPAQIVAAEGVRNMAAHLGQASIQTQAQTLLTNFLNARVALADFVPHLYDTGQRQPAPIRLNPNGTLRYEDIMGSGSPYNHDMIPYHAEERNRDTDPSQVNWWDGANYRVDAGVGYMYYPALSGYFPLSPELTARLRANLLDKTREYVKSYEVNNPWWWMSDLAHSTTGSGEHLYHSPTLAWTMFQVKAHVLQEDWNTLAHELPEPVSFNSRYDLYRLQNLVTLLELAEAANLSTSTKTVSTPAAQASQVVTYTIAIHNSGRPFTDTIRVSDTIPAGLEYVPGSLTATQGSCDDSDALTLRWSGTLSSASTVTITYAASVTVQMWKVISNTASIAAGSAGNLQKSSVIVVNGHRVYLPVILKW